MKTALIIDTSTLTSVENLPKFVTVVPLVIIETIGKESKPFLDVVEIKIKDIKKGTDQGKLYKTSQPNIGMLYETIENLYDKYDRIIINPISFGISSTYETIEGVVREIDKDKKILLIHSKQASYGGWALNQILYKLIEENKSNNEIMTTIDKYNKNHSMFFFLINIEFLVKGGRISPIKGMIVKKLKLVLSICWREGFLKPLSKNQDLIKLFKKSLELELEYKKRKESDILQICYYSDKSDIPKFEKQVIEIKKIYPNIIFKEVDFQSPGAVFVHTGLGALIFDIFYK